MSLASGSRVGPYEVLAEIGAGGMGVVYRARDTKLNRDVALKVLPSTFAGDADRLARFRREAQALAALNHPNIGHIYGLEETGSGHALVLELVEGPTLEERIAERRAAPVGPAAAPGPKGPGLLGHQAGAADERSGQGPWSRSQSQGTGRVPPSREAMRGGPAGLPLDDALAIARQIADALDAAHEHGIVHRDLKPANIKVRDDGTVKVLDFGLAKLTGPADSGVAAPELTASPTMSAAFTGAGVILGTAAYMAPEQARGRVVDKRADIWAFGCVLFEMLAGRRAFDGEDATEMIAAVVRGEPDWKALPDATPPPLRALLKRCLEKDPRRRLRDAGDMRFELDHVVHDPASAVGPAAAVPTTPRPLWRRAVPVAAAAVLSAAAAGYLAWTARPEATRPVVRFDIALPEGETFSFSGRHVVALSPAGTHLAYVANGELYLRALDELLATPIRGTEAGRSPFFSPDGQWVGFWQDRQLKKVSIAGGAPVTLCAADNPWGASWGPDDTVVFGQGPKGIMRVSGAGGTPEVLIEAQKGEALHDPQMLPGARAVLFTQRPQGAASWSDSQIVVHSLETGARTVVVNGGTDGRYVPTGHLVYAFNGTLLAVPFALDSLAAGGPVPLVEQVADAGELTGAAHFALSSDGTLAYVSRPGDDSRRALVWVDREQREEAIKAPPRAYRYPRLSPDGTRVALDLRDEELDIWIWHLAGETLTRLTLDSTTEQYAVWAGSEQVIFGSARPAGAVSNLFWQAADGTGAAERLTESQNVQFPMSVSPDGAYLVLREDVAANINGNLMMLPLRGERRTQPLLQTPFNELNAEISPDGRWLAYQSNESGRDEIYVRPFPNVNDGRWQVSTGGGRQPLWGRSGRDLFYVTLALDAFMRVEVSTGGSLQTGNPAKLLDTRAYYFPDVGGVGSVGRMYDISPDGRRFLLLKTVPGDEPQAAAPASITVVSNWFEELRRRVPGP